MDLSTNTETNSTEDSGNQSSQVVNPGNKILTVKLSKDNFVMWKVQIEFALEGHDLETFINDDLEPPPKRISVSENSSATEVNPEYTKWKKQDQLISSWLLGSMTENILEQVIHNCKFSREIWKCLLQIFNSRNKAQVMRMKNRLQTIQKGGMPLGEYFSQIKKKGGMPLSEYFSQIKKCIDALVAIGKTIDEEDHVLYILGGLGPDYDNLIDVAL